MAKNISIIGVPMDYGQELRGVDMGPAALRYTGLIPRLRQLGHKVTDQGDVAIPIRDGDREVGPDKFLSEITEVCERIYTAGAQGRKGGGLSLISWG